MNALMGIGDNKVTMLSTQLGEILGYEPKEVNKKIRAMFGEDKARENFSPDLDSQNRVIVYHLPELESKMFVAKHDITYLEKITQFWIDRKAPEQYQIPNFTNPAEAAIAWAKEYERAQIAESTKAEIGHRREATSMNTASQATKKANKLEIELDRSKEYYTVKRMGMMFHGQKFNWRTLKSTANEMEIPSIDIFDANYGTVKAYHVDVWREAYAVEV